ncbi:MAG TPA: peptide MFS transporter [Bacteroidia bacterium]|jgi:POT family proton-dependent oligopeptide transporter|uniref:peptide MFS transporter n=1 Tax=Candidatus Pollutiaquabacter sp. TaxID=3416354 RepID=UPI001A575709|nr:peptide MFS transporter [Bacteroidota bacterium]MBL7947833.1 peptide MFS transporter [Bacteroidia bacterium]HRS38236.1 peptide MFS transporter [Bacteroidia bacterium]HRU62008.1 peptide MFS transporter [Bacteroidia bacterium]
MSYSLEQIRDFKGKYPKQLWYLFFSEMWERFCFYGMRGMLTVFMVDKIVGLSMREDVANLQYGATQAFVYAFTFIGGLFADKILGFRKSLFWGGLLMISGSCILAADPKDFFFLGISFTIVGTGFFKPNISTMVGALYNDGDHRRDAGFSLFYAGINIGALLGGYACVAIAKSYSWNLAFGLAAIVMTISLLTFVFTQRSLGPIGRSPMEAGKGGKRWYEYATYIGSLAVIPLIMTMVAKTEYTDWFMYIIGPCTLIYMFYEMTRYSAEERKKLIAALVFILFSVLFWAFFEQSGGSLNLFASNNLKDSFLGVKLDPNGVNNSANSLFVIIFAPLSGLFWLWLSNRKAEPNTVVKFGLGFLFLSLAFYVFYSTRFFAGADGMTSLEVFTLAYFVITFGELCLSPIGLSIMTKLSPQPLQGVMMGMWFLASAYGQYVAGILGAGMASPNENATLSEKLISYTDGYQQLAIYAVISGVVLIAISPMVRRLMGNVK